MQVTSNPIDTTPNTPLDSLKTAVLRAVDGLGAIGDTLAGFHNVSDDDEVMQIIDRLSHQLKTIVAEHVPDVEVPTDGLLSPEHARLLNTYDNGSPVKITRSVGNHVISDIWPRIDTQLDALRTSTQAADLAQQLEEEGLPG
ncbi:hypothetical protein P9139_17990 [Curtobacterium flaccumfaciens]|nr:hypothetical protein P9139_17990 [Curtobacterium flaccumfaciens]